MLTGRKICIHCQRDIDATADGDSHTVTLPGLIPACASNRCAIKALAAFLRDEAHIASLPMQIIVGGQPYQPH